MSDCKDCAAAQVGQHHGFRAGCMGCCARATARGPHYWRVKQAGALDRQYRQALEHFKLTHEQVKAADAADFMRREVKR